MSEREPDDLQPDDETTTSPHGDELEELIPGEDPGSVADGTPADSAS